MTRAGELGEVFSTECIWTCCMPLDGGGWRDSGRCLGGVFQDHGSHSLDLAAHWLASPARSVFAHAQRIGTRLGSRREVEDHMTAVVTHDSGASSTHLRSRSRNCSSTRGARTPWSIALPTATISTPT
jgi:predicted dehydrogenase